MDDQFLEPPPTKPSRWERFIPILRTKVLPFVESPSVLAAVGALSVVLAAAYGLASLMVLAWIFLVIGVVRSELFPTLAARLGSSAIVGASLLLSWHCFLAPAINGGEKTAPVEAKVASSPAAFQIAVYSDFRMTYDKRGLLLKLGKPLAPAYELTTFQSSHVNKNGDATMVMFTEVPPMLCRLYDDRSARCESDPDWKRDVTNYDPTTLKVIFKNVPKGKFPPYGGVASRWLDEKKGRDWSAIGWSGWQCSNDHAHLQEFERGRMVGLFRNVPKENNEGQIFVILDRVKDWDSWIPDIDKSLQAPACDDPLANWKKR
jgi:hypothetical protein